MMRLTENHYLVAFPKTRELLGWILRRTTTLGPAGVQQVTLFIFHSFLYVAVKSSFLDMTFVRCFASQGRYLSRNLNRIVNEITSKALSAFAYNWGWIHIVSLLHPPPQVPKPIVGCLGVNLGVILPEDEWFTEICQDAMERLSGKPKAANGERDLNSPTASVSAQSISSVRSHGSN
nr:exocyst complex component EXO84B-like [Ipomoea batatas]